MGTLLFPVYTRMPFDSSHRFLCVTERKLSSPFRYIGWFLVFCATRTTSWSARTRETKSVTHDNDRDATDKKQPQTKNKIVRQLLPYRLWRNRLVSNKINLKPKSTWDGATHLSEQIKMLHLEDDPNGYISFSLPRTIQLSVDWSQCHLPKLEGVRIR